MSNVIMNSSASPSLESIYRLSLILGRTLNREHEAHLFVEWLFQEAKLAWGALFLSTEQGMFSLVAARGLQVPEGILLSPGTEINRWLETQEGIPRSSAIKRALLPIILNGKLFGLLALASEAEDTEWEQICELADVGLMQLAVALRSAERYAQVERLAEERMAALRESEERFRLLSEFSLTGIYLIQDGKFRYVNPALAKIFKYQVEELIDRLGPLDLTHPDDRPMVQEYIRQRVDGEVLSIRYRFRGLCKDGRVRTIEVHGTRIEYQGRPAILGTLMDVTEQVRHERELEVEAILARAIGEEKEIQPLLERLLTAVRHAIPTAEKGSILLLERDGRLRIRALSGYTDPRLYDFAFAQEQRYSARALRERRPLLIADARTDPQIRYDGEIEKARAIQSAIVAPLLVHGEPIGVISLDSTQKNAFTAQDLEMLAQFAFPAALLIERERLFREARSRVDELELLYQSSVKFNEALTPPEVAQALLEVLSAHFSWHHIAIRLLTNNQEFQLVGAKAPPGSTEEQEQELLEKSKVLVRTVDQGLSGLAIRQKSTILAPDVHAFLEYAEVAPEVRSGIYVPLKGKDEVIGVIAIESETPAAFDEESARLIETIAAQAATAFERARWIEETQRRADESTAMLVTSLALSRLDLQGVLEAIVTHAQRLFHADSCRIFLMDEGEKTLSCVVVMGENPQAFKNLRIHLNEGVTGYVAVSGQAEIVRDMSQDPRAVVVPGTPDLPEAAMFAPLRFGERILGVLSVHRQDIKSQFTPSELDFLQAFASMAASAVANAQLFADLRKRLHELEAIHEVSAQLRHAETVDEMIPIFIRHMARIIGAGSGSVYLREKDSGDWVSKGWATAEGVQEAPVQEMRHRPQEGVTGWVGTHGEIYVTEDWRTDQLTRILPGEEKLLAAYQSGISIPLRAAGETIGVLHLWLKEKRSFTSEEKHLLLTLADITGNALKRARLMEETLHRVQQLQAIHEIDRAIRTSLNLDTLLDVWLQHVLVQLKADAVGVLFYDEEKQLLEPVRTMGVSTHLYTSSSLVLGQGIAGLAAVEGRPIYVVDVKQVQRPARLSMLEKENIRACAAIPLSTKSKLLGVLEVFFRSPFFFDDDWKRFFDMLAQQGAIAIEHVRFFEALQRAHTELSLAYEETIEGWSRALDLRDRETEGHTQRVTELTVRLAQAMNLPAEQIAHIRRGALLHDIGKMGVPDALLFKPGPLTSEEWAIMHLHPQFAYDMLSPIKYLQPALDIPYCHHEKWDGTGYPRGLKGSEIPLAARLFAVADVYDALTSDRPYRKAWSRAATLEYIRQQAGKHFDPQVVELFLKIMEKGG